MFATSRGVGVLAALALAGASACSSSGDGGERGGASTGTVTEPWTDYCVATFTEDHVITDFFDEPLFTARAGEQYLVGRYGELVDQDRAELLYMTDLGPYDLEFSAPLGSRDFPFTTNCEFDSPKQNVAVFADMTLYTADDLKTELCTLTAGTVTPNSGSGSGYGWVRDAGGQSIYEVYLGAMSQECGGATVGYVSVPETRVLGIYTWLVPFGVVIDADR